MSDAGKRLIAAAKEANEKVVSFDDHRFQRAVQVLRTAGFSDVADECSNLRSFYVRAKNLLDCYAAKSGKDKTDE